MTTILYCKRHGNRQYLAVCEARCQRPCKGFDAIMKKKQRKKIVELLEFVDEVFDKIDKLLYRLLELAEKEAK